MAVIEQIGIGLKSVSRRNFKIFLSGIFVPDISGIEPKGICQPGVVGIVLMIEK